MFITHEQVVREWYFFFSWGSDGAGKNEFESVHVFTASFLRKLWKMKI